jgi:hypothetical protein
LQVGAYAALWYNSGFTRLASNVYDNGTNVFYLNTAAASYYQQNAGAHAWFNAPSGTAGATTSITSGLAYSVTTLGSTTLGQWQAFFSALTGIPSIGQTVTATATGTLAGGATVTQIISFTTAMTLDADGDLGIGTTSPNAKLHILAADTVTADLARFQQTNQGNLLIQSQQGGLNLGSANGILFSNATGNMGWRTGASSGDANMLLDASGNLLVGTTTASAGAVFKVTGATANSISHQVWTTASSTDAAYWTEGSGTVNGVATGSNAAAAMIRVNKDSGTTRSINAAGSLNASGADYAEYMTKAGNFKIAKGDICGIDENGKLTNVFAKAISFVVKSTDPAYVGGDTWFVEAVPSDEAELPAFKERMELARQMVDRIAFAGQVPVNVIGATAGQYIVPVNDNGAIKGIAVNSPTFEQYQIALGKVIAIESDGRARIIVKVV